MNTNEEKEMLYAHDPNYAVAPGETLQEVLESLGMSKKELALRCSLTEQTINRICRGEQPITYESAERLEMATGVPARMWNSLEMQYREQLAKIRRLETQQAQRAWIAQIPIDDLLAHREVQGTGDEAEIVGEALRFYGVHDVGAWRRLWQESPIGSFKELGTASAWVRMGQRAAHALRCGPFEGPRLRTAIQELSMLQGNDHVSAVADLQQRLADIGVALVLLPPVKGLSWEALVLWASVDKATIMLDREVDEGRFQSLLIEALSHVLRMKKKQWIILDRDSGKSSGAPAYGRS
ncbi:MAG: HigA family addiction module antidote protein [Thermoplasmatales archaeon]|jgi:HTH-type transcriptional regulator/antitoxin HigA|nr:HigA family addiction module antidote protein [Thermoplasmatales archaeon]